MGIYIFGWIYFTLFLFKWKLKASQKRNLYLIGTFCFILYIWAFRDTSVGTDTMHYIKYFQLYEQYSIKELLSGELWFKQMEPGFIIMSKLIMDLVKDEYICLQIIGIIYSVLFTVLLSKFKGMQLYWFGFAFYGLYIPCSGLNIMRQAIASLFLIYAFLSFRIKDKKGMLLFSLLACTFHYGAILPIAIMFWFFIVKNNTKMQKLLIIFSIIIGCLFFEKVLNIVGLGIYLERSGTDIAFLKGIILVLIYIIYIFKNIEDGISRLQNEIQFVETILLLAVLMNFMGAYSTAFIRVTSFLMPYACIPIVELISEDEKKVSRHSILLLGLYFSIMIFFYHSLSSNIGGIVPFDIIKKL